MTQLVSFSLTILQQLMEINLFPTRFFSYPPPTWPVICGCSNGRCLVGYLGLTTLNRLDNVKPIATRDLTVHHKKLELLIATGILVKSLYSLGSLIAPRKLSGLQVAVSYRAPVGITVLASSSSQRLAAAARMQATTGS